MSWLESNKGIIIICFIMLVVVVAISIYLTVYGNKGGTQLTVQNSNAQAGGAQAGGSTQAGGTQVGGTKVGGTQVGSTQAGGSTQIGSTQAGNIQTKGNAQVGNIQGGDIQGGNIQGGDIQGGDSPHMSIINDTATRCNMTQYVTEQQKNMAILHKKYVQYGNPSGFLMDDDVNQIINDSVNKFTGVPYEDLYCIYASHNKLNTCDKFSQLNQLNPIHNQINNILDKYIGSIKAIKNHLLNTLVYIINKDCTNIANKKNMLSAHIAELNRTFAKISDLLNISDDDESKMLNLINT